MQSDGTGRRWLWWLLPIVIAVLGASAFAAWRAGYLPLQSSGHRIQIDLDRLEKDAPPSVEPVVLRPLSPQEASEINAAIPGLQGPVEAALPFRLPEPAAGFVSARSALDCLTSAVYYESAGQPLQGQRAVAQVIVNRMRHPAFPKSICGVVYQGSELRTGCQFSFTCDGSLARTPSQSGWQTARLAASAILSGQVEPSVGTATHYHADYVVPYWASSLQKITTIGNHIFYRFTGFWGKRQAFNGAYTGEAANDPAASAAMVPFDMSVTRSEPNPLVQDDLSRSRLILPMPTLTVPESGTLIPHENKPTLRADEERGSLVLDQPAEPAPTPPEPAPISPG